MVVGYVMAMTVNPVGVSQKEIFGMENRVHLFLN